MVNGVLAAARDDPRRDGPVSPRLSPPSPAGTKLIIKTFDRKYCLILKAGIGHSAASPPSGTKQERGDLSSCDVMVQLNSSFDDDGPPFSNWRNGYGFGKVCRSYVDDPSIIIAGRVTWSFYT